MKASHHPDYVLPLPEGHPFPMGKYARLHALLLERGVLSPADLMQPDEAAREDLARVHDERYLDTLFGPGPTPTEQRRIGVPWSPRLLRRSRLAVQGTIDAARAALAQGIAGNLAGGTHHAFAGHGEGFCLLNDVAVAIRVLQAGREIAHALVVDLDVHQGNGTAAIFAGDASVFTFSMHGERNYPAVKQRSSLDVGLPDGVGDAAYLEALETALAQAWARTAAQPPGLAFDLAGADPHEDDRLGRLKLSLAGLAERDRRVLAQLQARGIPVALSMAGGYGRDIGTTVSIHCRTLELALQAWQAWQDRSALMEQCAS